MFTRTIILLAAAALSLSAAADAAFADPQPGHSDGYGYDKNGVFNDGYGYDKNGVFDDGTGYTDSNASTDGYGSFAGFNCDGNGADDAYGNANCGWHDGYFYPGFGTFLFDRHHHRHEMTGRQHDYFTRQARGPDGGRRVGLGSSGGVSRPQQMPGSGMGFGGGNRGGFGGMSGGFRGGGGGGQRG